MSVHQLTMHSPVGELTLSEDSGRIVSVDWGRGPEAFQKETALLKKARKQLEDYFDGKRKNFDLPLAPEGSDFQRAVWRAMVAIPFGSTRTYGDVAAELDASARAVGTACGANPIPILIPCHRITAAGGRLGGYSGSGGADTKRALLRLEMPAFELTSIPSPPQKRGSS